MRLACFFLALSTSVGQPRIELVTSDIENFWKAYDQSEPGNRAPTLQELYLNAGSPGLRDFLRIRIGTAQQLADAIERFPSYYATIRDNTLAVESKRAQIQLYLSQFQELYPEASFPPVYFMIGRISTGGTVTNAGLLIGTEVFSLGNGADTRELEARIPSFYRAMGTIDRLPYIVVHELVHTQQSYTGNHGLIEQTMIEGAAEFITNIVTGRTIRDQFLDWEESHRTELFTAFAHDYQANPQSYDNWLYNYSRVTDQPADIGYWIGAEICRSYFLRAVDKTQALRDIILMRNPFDVVLQSGYAWLIEPSTATKTTNGIHQDSRRPATASKQPRAQRATDTDVRIESLSLP